MKTTGNIAIAALFSLTLVAPALAAEDITEHETYEKRTMKIETVPAMATTTLPPSRSYQHHEESESTTVERHSATPPVPVVKERSRETTETKVEN